MYFLGVDGGGTNSRLVAVDESGKEYGPYFSGPTNHNSNSRENVKATFQKLLNDFFNDTKSDFNDISSFCLGGAGVNIEFDILFVEQLLKEIGLKCPIKVVNDVEIVLESEIREGEEGMILLSGTGSIAYGKNLGGKTHRIGGWGHIIGDEGSGYSVGLKAMIHCMKFFDKRRNESALPYLVKEHFKINDISELMRIVYSENLNKAHVAALSTVIDKAAKDGDEYAKDILKQAADDLFEMADVMTQYLGLSNNQTIVMTGGFILKSDELRKHLLPKLKTISTNIRNIKYEPYQGAIIIAQKALK